MRAGTIVSALLAVLFVAACSRPPPPVGRWEGTYDRGGSMVAARVEIDSHGLVRISAPNAENVSSNEEERATMRQNLADGLASGWDEIEPRMMDFDGRVFRRKGGIAPQMVWEKDRKQMLLVVYLGKDPAREFPLRAVGDFSSDPWQG